MSNTYFEPTLRIERTHFADVFEVKSGHIVRRGQITTLLGDAQIQRGEDTDGIFGKYTCV